MSLVVSDTETQIIYVKEPEIVYVTDASGETQVVYIKEPELVYVNDASIPGPTGPQGLSPDISIYKKATLSIASGVLTIDATAATTFYLLANQNITSIVVNGWPASGLTQRIAVYVQQDSAGNHLIASSAWPAGTRSPAGIRPTLTVSPNAIDCFVLDTFDDGQTIFATMVGYDYS